MSKVICCVLCVLLICCCCSLSVAAQTDVPLLPTDAPTPVGNGDCVYTPDGALQLTSADDGGVSVSIAVNKTVNIHTTKYLQLAIETNAPFNVALKLSGDEYDIYPQTAGPSWYEVFQEKAPTDGAGVKSGSYAVSLDLKNYVDYNDLEITPDGFMTLKTVFITIDGAGAAVVRHLALSDVAEFATASGQKGEAAATKVAITTAASGVAARTTAFFHDGFSAIGDRSGIPVGGIVVLSAAAVLVIAMPLLSLLKKRRKKDPYDGLFDDKKE